MSNSSSPFEDPFGLGQIGRQLQVRVGGLDVTASLSSTWFARGIKEHTLGSATLKLDPAAGSSAFLDYVGEVTIDAHLKGMDFRQFTGSVLNAEPSGDRLTLQCGGSPALTERGVEAMSHRCPAVDVIYCLARSAGLPSDRLQLDGFDTLPVEVFEVTAPVEGVQVATAVRLGPVTFVPALSGHGVVGPHRGSGAAERFLAAGTYAVVYVTAQRLFDAETAGLMDIDAALAWLKVRSCYSSAVLPSGEPLAWSRESRLKSPRRTDVVAVRGLVTSRSWIRVRALVTPKSAVDLTGADSASLRPNLGRSWSTLQRQAWIACARASSDTDPFVRVTALFEALEFYVGGTKVPDFFTKAELKAIKAGIKAGFPEGLPAAKRERLFNTFAHLNDPPLLARLRHRVAVDGVPITESEIDLLWKLRTVRNDLAHGTPTDAPSEDSVDRCVGLVARMLVFSASTTRRSG
jgi:hypothetical protein